MHSYHLCIANPPLAPVTYMYIRTQILKSTECKGFKLPNIFVKPLPQDTPEMMTSIKMPFPKVLSARDGAILPPPKHGRFI